ncbi:MAG: NTP transferase domain-containing protein [Gammaproteobacteria bacterium]|nr:NTP transferase domain-containing protein [Gammaproteobacteria bacterium]
MTLGVILAGGVSRRMGTDKALIDVAGLPAVEWVAAALRRVCDSTIVLGREKLGGLRCLPDIRTSVRGPLVGLATALGSAHGQAVLLVAVDQPFLQPRTLQRLLDLASHEAVIPVDGARQVTCAVYPASWTAETTDEIDSGGSIQSLLDRLPHHLIEPPTWREWGEDGRSWFSVDTPEALAEGLARYGQPG